MIRAASPDLAPNPTSKIGGLNQTANDVSRAQTGPADSHWAPHAHNIWVSTTMERHCVHYASSRVMTTGTPGSPFMHRRGLRQGNPYPQWASTIPQMDPLPRLLPKAIEANILLPIPLRAARLRTSFYADDAFLFVNPWFLTSFGQISGPKVNQAKSVIYPIQCHNLDAQGLVQGFGEVNGVFLSNYLGLPLSIRKLRSIEVQYMLDMELRTLKYGGFLWWPSCAM